ncbi:hypothetical protein niasHT_027973 [Heterodera trifolii]|uniref:Galectin n=1 Tax=Heterodera trifolii TaxID=157864 RepID=A0ABD2KEI1_9BILA
MDNCDFSVPAHRNVSVPFASDIIDGVFPGKAILVKGTVLASVPDQRFAIDLCCGILVNGDHRDDKALHFNPRFDSSAISLFSKPDRDIVLNSLINNVWGAEQRCANPLEKGRPFSVRILILRDYFKVSLNGKHLSDFIHRIPIDRIKCIYVQGCVAIELIEYQGTCPRPSSPMLSVPSTDSSNLNEPIEISKPEIPFIFSLPFDGFAPFREVLVILTPLLNASYFAINVLRGTDYIFHMRVDLPNQIDRKRGAIVRNSTTDGVWQNEERQLGRFPFTLGVTSDLKITAVAQGFKVFVDGASVCDFTFRASAPPPTEANRLTIVGDVGVQKFIFRNQKN